jgi:hypothetical protein
MFLFYITVEMLLPPFSFASVLGFGLTFLFYIIVEMVVPPFPFVSVRI